MSGVGANDHHAQSHSFIAGDHTITGLTTGHFLKATGSSSYAFQTHGLTYSDVGAAASSHTHSSLTGNWSGTLTIVSNLFKNPGTSKLAYVYHSLTISNGVVTAKGSDQNADTGITWP